MRFFTIVAPGLAFVSGVFSATNAGLQAYIGGTLSKDNHYGAPIPPWKQGCYPGWYFGNHHDWTGGYVPWLKDEPEQHLCGWLEQIPWCLKCPNHPPPPPPPSPPPPSPPPPGPPPPPHYPPHYPPHSPPPPPHSSPPPPHSPPPPPHSPPSPPHSPPHPPYYGFKEVFDGYDGAVQAGDYLTFGLVDTVEGRHSCLVLLPAY
ncbi:hypothetical protein VNI00_012259 [Paramarasmius palmivorus]|uniref:Uncharacterized protein n=1 Tax=Paramarasmius palmivorus TaxID=297713 RepID=A0AAW0C7U7_9AGAR